MNIAFTILIILNFFIIFNFENIAKTINLYDYPDNNLKRHKKKIPIIGGIIFILNFYFISFFDLFIHDSFLNLFLTKESEYLFILILFLFFSLGLIDDKINVNPNIKFIFLTLITLLSVYLDKSLLIQKFSLSFYSHKIFLNDYSIFFSVFCIVILINALNFYDGINGQSLIFFIISFSYLLIVTKKYEFYGLIIFILIILLYLNLNNKLFMGDSGIYLLAVILSTSIIYEHNIYENIEFADEIFLLLFLPGLDLLRLSIFRLIKGKNPFFGDRSHIHHILIDNFSLLRSNLILLFLILIPLILFSVLKINFFLVLVIILFIYFILILKFRAND